MSQHRLGLLLGAAAYLMWGLFPLYWPLLEPATATEILAHRIVWSMLLVAVLLAVRGRLGALRQLPRRARGYLVVASVLIAINWGTYIYGVNSNQVIETSLGYFIGPLVTVAVAVVLLDERLRRAQWAALALAAVAVAVLTVDYGRLPWIALTLAFSFAGYGLLKKKANVGAAESLAVETLVLVVPALTYLMLLHAAGTGTFGQVSLPHTLLLVGAGVVTVLPLLAFSGAAIRIPLSTIGLLQYLGPTLQFLIGVLLYAEPLPPVRLLGFVLVWVSLALFTAESLAHRRRQLQLAATPSG